MSEATKPNIEVSQQAVLETKVITPGTSYGERVKAEKASKIKHENAEQRQRDALGLMVNAEDDSKYIAESKRVTTIKRGADGKEVAAAADPEGHARRNGAEVAILTANKAIKEGWPTDAAEQDVLLHAIEPAFAKLWPEARAWLADARRGDARSRAFLAEKFQDPHLQEILKDMLDKRSVAKPPQDMEVPAELARKKKEAEILVTQNTDAQTRVNTDLARVEGDLKREYGDPTITPRTPGSRDTELARLRADKGTFQSNVSSLTRDVNAKEARLNQLVTARASAGTSTIDTFDATGLIRTGTRTDTRGGDPAAIQTQIDALTLDLDDPTTGLKKQLRDAEAELTKLKEYEDDLRNWTAEAQRLKKEKQDLVDKGELLKADLEGLTEQTQKVIEARTEWEKQYVAKLDSVLADGMSQYVSEQLQDADETQQRMLEEEAANAEDPVEKAVLKKMTERWNKRKKSGFIRIKEVSVVNKDNVDTDYATLMDPTKGPEAIMREMLGGTLIPDATLGITRPITPAEIDAKLADKEFMDKMQGEVLATLLQKRMRTAKMGKTDFEYIADSPWVGQLEAAINKRGAGDKLKAQMEAAGVAQGTMHEFFATKGKKKGALLGLLLAVITAGVIPGMMIKEIIAGQGS